MLRIKNLRWEFGTVLPEEIKYNLCEQEVKEVKKKWFQLFCTRFLVGVLYTNEV